jgi:hypothetical protein
MRPRQRRADSLAAGSMAPRDRRAQHFGVVMQGVEAARSRDESAVIGLLPIALTLDRQARMIRSFAVRLSNHGMGWWCGRAQLDQGVALHRGSHKKR